MSATTSPRGDLTWLVNDLVGRVDQTRHAVVLSADGLLMATSSEPWNAPHTNSAPINASRLPVSPTSGPAAQYPISASCTTRLPAGCSK